jgi:hypothetical protein
MSEIIYNVTVNVSEDSSDAWLLWMKETHIPEVLGTGLFRRATLMRVHAFEQGGFTYAVQFVAGSMADYERYLKQYAPLMRTKTEALYGQEVQSFRTMLEVLSNFEPKKH